MQRSSRPNVARLHLVYPAKLFSPSISAHLSDFYTLIRGIIILLSVKYDLGPSIGG
jgi:hypothetical protein